jgi:uncharacterized membrane protein
MFHIILGVIIFLVGFYCGKFWVTKLAGKTVSFSLRTAVAVLFLVVVVIILIITSVSTFRPKKTWSTSHSTYQLDTSATR